MHEDICCHYTTLFRSIESIPYMTCIKPEGAFYLFPHVQKCAEQCGYDTVDAFVKDILREKHVAFVPGSGFGAPEYARISYSTDRSEEQTSELQSRFDI